ncbi:MAG: DUF2637 domain-containing protein [Actinomycetes bacterium]
MSRLARWITDVGPLTVIAGIAGAASFTHIHDTAAEHGQPGWMAWAIAVCIDLLAVMAAREIQRDMRGHRRCTWPVLVLSIGAVLSLAANLAQAEPSPWGRIMAGTPAGAFLVAISMVERRARTNHATQVAARTGSDVSPAGGPEPVPTAGVGAWPGPSPDLALLDSAPSGPAVPEALLGFARKVAADHLARQGRPIDAASLRARLGVSRELAEQLHAHTNHHPERGRE